MWGIGGLDKRNPDNNDEGQVEAIAYAFSKGLNFFETVLWYAEGWAAKLAAQALKKSGKKRDEIFISQGIYQYKLADLAGAEKEVEDFEEIFQTEYVDTMLFPLGAYQKFGQRESIEFFHKMLDLKKTRSVSVTNANLPLLKTLHKEFGDKLFSHELTYSFEIRENDNLGIIGFANGHGMLNVVFQPLRRNRTAVHNWSLLTELAAKYHKTQNQIIINWIVSRGFLPLNKSENTKHIDENLAALEFVMDKNDLNHLTSFRVPGYRSPKIDWNGSGDGVPVFMLPNVFDDEYKKQIL